jgi:hypothetical protein
MTQYILKDGLLDEVPDDSEQNTPNTTVKTTVADPQKALTYSCTFLDASNAARAAGTKLSSGTQEAYQTVQSNDYINQFRNPTVSAEYLMRLINQIFTKLQAPIGLLYKLIVLKDFNIDIVIDDSSSMDDGVRWPEARARVLEFINLLQVIPTGKVTISFLDRSQSITIDRKEKEMTPEQFYETVSTWINTQFRTPPRGGTPIYRNLAAMLARATGKTAHYIITDGEPTDPNFGEGDEITAIKNLILNRLNPQYNPITFLCCSTNPETTMWMHMIEDLACRPGAPGFVAALQNFLAERLEVLNDQGAWFPYSRPVWLLCSLVAALNPNDLDALDQHAPLSKPIIDTFLGRQATLTEYEGYFIQHPTATWVFKEDFNAFVNTAITNQIPSVCDFETKLAELLNIDINNRNDASEPKDNAVTEEYILQKYNRLGDRPYAMRQARQGYWVHYIAMEKNQLSALQSYNNRPIVQHLWADYVYYSGMIQMWLGYVQGFHAALDNAFKAQQTQMIQQTQVDQQAQEGEAPPPPYKQEPEASLLAPRYDAVIEPIHNYSGYIQPVSAYSQSSSPVMFATPSTQPTNMALQSQSYDDQQQYYRPNNRGDGGICCNIL